MLSTHAAHLPKSASLILLSLGLPICFTSLSQIFVLTFSSSFTTFTTLLRKIRCLGLLVVRTFVVHSILLAQNVIHFNVLTGTAFAVAQPYQNPLSWICFTLRKFRFCNFVAVRSIPSLPGIRFAHSVHKSAVLDFAVSRTANLLHFVVANFCPHFLEFVHYVHYTLAQNPLSWIIGGSYICRSFYFACAKCHSLQRSHPDVLGSCYALTRRTYQNPLCGFLISNSSHSSCKRCHNTIHATNNAGCR